MIRARTGFWLPFVSVQFTGIQPQAAALVARKVRPPTFRWSDVVTELQQPKYGFSQNSACRSGKLEVLNNGTGRRARTGKPEIADSVGACRTYHPSVVHTTPSQGMLAAEGAAAGPSLTTQGSNARDSKLLHGDRETRAQKQNWQVKRPESEIIIQHF